MPEKFKVAEEIYIKALGPGEAQEPGVYIVLDDPPDHQRIPVLAKEIKAMIAALTDAAVCGRPGGR